MKNSEAVMLRRFVCPRNGSVSLRQWIPRWPWWSLPALFTAPLRP